MNVAPTTTDRSARWWLGSAGTSVVGFWLFYIVLSTARSLLLNPIGNQTLLLALRLMVGGGSVLITLLLLAALQPFAQRRKGVRITIAALLCAPAALAFATLNAAVYRDVPPCGSPPPTAASLPVVAAPMCDESWGELIGEHAFTGYFLMATWAALYLLLGYAAEVGRWERRAGELRAAAQTAELRALRYQVNPHFLFNTLNALSTLIMAKRVDEADAMILDLSTYYRASLGFDPASDVTLAEEVELQRLYLAIEQRRFPERMRAEVALPPSLADARVPGMLLQPLVENAVKHGVARSRGLVTVRVAAREESGRLHLDVTDDAAPVGKTQPGGGIGLRNVADRLRARYGDDASCRCEQGQDGGYRVDLDLPLVRR